MSASEEKAQRFEEFWLRLTKALQTRGLTETGLSAAMKSPTYVSKLKKNKRLPRTDKLQLMSAILNVAPSELLPESPDVTMHVDSKPYRPISMAIFRGCLEPLIMTQLGQETSDTLNADDYKRFGEKCNEWLALPAADGEQVDFTNRLYQFLLITLAMLAGENRQPVQYAQWKSATYSAARYGASLHLAPGRHKA
ncbi:MAG: helix-turn-helix transcriptional regulator [Pseudomonadota bacterium]